jgi:hypothetical protein
VDINAWVPFAGMAVGLLTSLGSMALVALIVYLVAQNRSQRAKERADLNAKLLERMASTREFGDFLASEAGDRFLRALNPTLDAPRVARIAGFGVAALVFGLVLFGAGFTGVLGTARPGLNIVAILTAAIGLASLMAAAASHFLARRLESSERAPRKASSAA